ncbi:MAG: hypothetical protein AAF562_13680, partial [Pseudomonadota bacterium]
LTADRRIWRNAVERAAFRRAKLLGFFLSPGLQKKKITLQAARILTIWDRMVAFSLLVEGGAYQVPERGEKFASLDR